MEETGQQPASDPVEGADGPERDLERVRRWVRERADPAFREKVRQESLAIARSEEEAEIAEWIELVSDRSGWEG